MHESPLLRQLIDALKILPGVGKKSAQRIAYQLLLRQRQGARDLATALNMAMEQIGYCESCRLFSETPLCAICSSPKRDRSLLCVVESPADVAAIEEANYRGLYFVLMGSLSPLDGIGPSDLGLDKLKLKIEEGEIEEVIMATSTTVEGEATAHYISDMVRAYNIKVSRIAHGIPMGGELEYIDSNTLSHALAGRRDLNS